MITVQTESGILSGRQQGGVLLFRGIPYARPPVESLRFAPPADPDPWEGVRDAAEFGSPSLQMYTENHVTQKQTLDISREDCLYLNVSSPADGIPDENGIHPDPDASLPVYVFVHGGSYETGGGNMPLYRGENFVKQGIVYVTVNYRLGPFAAMTLDALDHEYGMSGGLSVLDLKKALEWVHRNISRFGGDPEQVTLGGESAGASLVSLLMHEDSSRRRFRRCILESGTARGFAVKAKYGRGNRDRMKHQCREILSELGCTDDPDGLQRLRSLPAEQILYAWYFKKDGSLRSVLSDPVLQGTLFEQDCLPDPASHRLEGIDLLFGYNTDEGSMFAGPHGTEEEYRSRIHAMFPEHAEELLQRYPVDREHTPFSRLSDIIGWAAFKAPTVDYADVLADQGAAVYGYHFNYLSEKMKEEGLGVRHIAELNFVFNRYLRIVGADDASGRRTADAMNAAWAAFIKTGSPNCSELAMQGVHWQPYDTQRRSMLQFHRDGCKMVEMEHKEDLFFFQQLMEKEYGDRGAEYYEIK